MENNLLQSIIFWVFAALAVGGALGAVFQRSIVYAALSMLLVFLSMSGFFILNNADFLAIAQLIIYAVGLTIIMLFAIMFTGDKPLEANRVDKSRIAAYSIVTVLVFGLLYKAISFAFRPTSFNAMGGFYVNDMLPEQGSTGMLGLHLFSRFGLPFEVASVLLLVAMVGAIVLAKKRFDEHEETSKYTLDASSAPTAEAQRAIAVEKQIGDQHPAGVN